MPRQPAASDTAHTDAVLAATARDGNAAALGELYQRHGDALLATAFSLLRSVPQAEDVLHDVFVGLPEALRRYDERGNLLGWLRLITARLALRAMRADARRAETDLAPFADVIATEQTLPDADALTLQHALDALPASLRTVVVLKYIEGYSHREIAALLDITAGASEVRLVRAMQRLRATLGSRL